MIEKHRVSRWRFSIKRLFLIVFIAAALLAVWRWLNAPIVLRPAMASDRVGDRYFGIHSEHAKLRNVAVAEGVFSRSTWLSTSLYIAEAGQVNQLSSSTVGRSPNRLGELPWKRMKITLALGERQTPRGTITELGTAGQSRGGGSGGGDFVHHISTAYSQAFAGPISTRAECVVYAEGDRPIVLDRPMTVEEFLHMNVGNYLIITAQIK